MNEEISFSDQYIPNQAPDTSSEQRVQRALALRNRTPNIAEPEMYTDSPEAYIAQVKDLHDSLPVGMTAAINAEKPVTYESYADNWRRGYRAVIRQLLINTITNDGDFTSDVWPQFSYTLQRIAAVPELFAEQQFATSRQQLLESQLGTDNLEPAKLRRLALTGYLGDRALNDLEGQIDALDYAYPIRPFDMLAGSQRQKITDTIGTKLLDFWATTLSSTHPVSLRELKAPLLTHPIEDLTRIISGYAYKREIVETFIYQPDKFLTTIALTEKPDEEMSIERQIIDMEVGQAVALAAKDEKLTQQQFTHAVFGASYGVAARLSGDQPVVPYRWDTIHADVCTKFMKNFNGRIMNPSIMLAVPPETNAPESEGHIVEYYILCAELKSSGKSPVPKAMEIKFTYRDGRVHRAGLRAVSGREPVDAMLEQGGCSAK